MSDNITLAELGERLAERRDPDEIIELLDIESAELVNAFPDKVEFYYEQLVQELFDDDEDE